jgi:hypothetical protein
MKSEKRLNRRFMGAKTSSQPIKGIVSFVWLVVPFDNLTLGIIGEKLREGIVAVPMHIVYHTW